MPQAIAGMEPIVRITAPADRSTQSPWTEPQTRQMSSHVRAINPIADASNVSENARPASAPSRLISGSITSARSRERCMRGMALTLGSRYE